MSDLLQKLQSATEGSREFDKAVLIACGWYCDAHGHWKSPVGMWHVSADMDLLPLLPSRNLQNAVSLVPEGCGWSVARARPLVVSERSGPRRQWAYNAMIWAGIDCNEEWLADRYPTPALALCIAIIKAHESKEAEAA